MKTKAVIVAMVGLLLALDFSLAQVPLVLDDEELRSGMRGLLTRFRDPVPAVNLESPHVHPLDLSKNNRWLAAANTFADKVEVFELKDGVPEHRESVFTGVNPVSVRFRSNEELWVANHVSDSISILELPSGRVKQILQTHDEPADIIFSEVANKAYVSCSQENCLLVYDLSDLNADPEEIPIQGDDPRSLAVSPDGRYVFASVFESGNGTTVLGGGRSNNELLAYPPNVVSSPDGPYGGVNPPPNDGDETTPSSLLSVKKQPVSLIVKKGPDGRWMDDNKGDWTSFVTGKRAPESGRIEGWDLLDHDLAVLDTQTNTVRYAKGLMNICMAIDVNPADGTVSMVGTDAMNHIRYEPNLKGVFVHVKQATLRMSPDGSLETVANKDLNPHLDYTVASVPKATRELSIGDPRAIVRSRNGDRAYIAGMGSNNVIVTGPTGDRLLDGKTIEVGEGPTGLVLNSMEDRLYTLNRFEGSISVIDTETAKEVERVDYFDPTPETIKRGRKHLYDTHKNSGLGQASCASCHVDARMDRLAWDLGDASQPAEELRREVDEFVSKDGARLKSKLVSYSMVKGPMVTQTLQGLIGNGPFHWRGDKDDVDDFNVFYESLLGADSQLTSEEMREFKDYLNTITFPPNPFRKSDHSMPDNVPLPNQFAVVDGKRMPLPDGDPVRGGELFNDRPLSHFEGRDCASCHQGSASGGGYEAAAAASPAVSELVSLTQPEFKPSQLRNLHEKVGFDAGSSASLSGFGYLHDGSIDTLTRYLRQPQFEESISLQDVADTIAFLYSKNGADVPAPESDVFHRIKSGLLPPGTGQDLMSVLFGRPEALAKAMHAGVGTQLTINPEIDPPIHVFARGLFLSRVEKSNGTVGVVLHTEIEGERRTWVYDVSDRVFVGDRREAQKLSSITGQDGFKTGMMTMVHPHMIARLIGDADGDGLYDDEETRDLDPTLPGVQNPFDPFDPDTTGFKRDEPDFLADGLGDLDGDGISNREEFINGTNPIRAESSDSRETFWIKAIPRGGRDAVRGVSLKWEHKAGFFYVVERSYDLETWETVAGPFTGGGSSSFGSASKKDQYFRVRQLP